MGLLDSILLWPVKIPYFIGNKVNEVAMEELLDEDGVREELRELYMLIETGKISGEEFERQEEELVERLEEIQAYKEGR
jgi:hypothetical protein